MDIPRDIWNVATMGGKIKSQKVIPPPKNNILKLNNTEANITTPEAILKGISIMSNI